MGGSGSGTAVTATLLLLLLASVCAVCEGKCRVAGVFQDAPNYDLDGMPLAGLTLRGCAVACRGNRDCIGFVTSPDQACWLKYALGPIVSPSPERAIFITEGDDCTDFFSR